MCIINHFKLIIVSIILGTILYFLIRLGYDTKNDFLIILSLSMIPIFGLIVGHIMVMITKNKSKQ